MTNENRHTPGPWETRGGGKYKTHVYAPNVGDGNGGLVATMDVGCHNEEADGRLIAAAPCLFKLLKQLCFDRGVIIHATTVADSRESFREICAKHGIEVKDDVGGWQDGRTWVRPEGNRTHSE